MSDSEEFFDIVDEHDVVIGAAPRGVCHGNPALIHRAVHVLLFNKAGELLLQKRSSNKDIQPGKGTQASAATWIVMNPTWLPPIAR